jgi:hypothetical protein
MKPHVLILGFISIIGLGIVIGYQIGVFSFNKRAVPNTVIQTDTPYVSPAVSEQFNRCPSNFSFFKNAYYEFCYPSYLKQITEASSSGQTFTNETEQLMVFEPKNPQVKISLCVEKKSSKIASASAVRYEIRSEGVAGCESIYKFITDITTRKKDKIWLTLSKTKGFYISDSIFEHVEQSFRIVDTAY